MTAVPATGARVRLDDLKVGPLLAEGGEGRVFLLPRQPHLLLKAYRTGGPRPHLDPLVAWPDTLPPEREARVRDASAWPVATVTDPDGRPVGLLIPRAPRRFSVRHRDGHSRLASLSYLTADPAHRAAAYGLELPAPAGAARVGLVYALARLLDAFESGPAIVGHGDLSTKNVLWSLQRGPEVFVIDCDNSDIFAADGSRRGTDRRRAMTPNWDDPAVARGSNPTMATDRYSLALIFLRVVGAANFPIQARQRVGGPVHIEFPVPPGPGSQALLYPDAPVWQLCSRALSVAQPEGRPPAAAWLPEFERLLRAMGGAATQLVVDTGTARRETSGAEWTYQAGTGPGDVSVIPVRGARRSGRTWSKVTLQPRYAAAVPGASAPGPGGLVWCPTGPGQAAPSPGPSGASRPSAGGAGGGSVPRGGPVPSSGAAGGGQVVSGVAVWPEIQAMLLTTARWWLDRHRAMGRALRTPGGWRRGLHAAGFCLVIDVVLAVVVLVVLAMITAPVLGL